MGKILFVCYQHGCRGEFLSHKISQHDFFKTLDAEKVNGRTIIDNDFYNKKLLSVGFPQTPNFPLPEDNIVVPSHYYCDKIIPHFPDASFVSIESPVVTEQFRNDLYERYYCYSTDDTLKLIGECRDQFRRYNIDATLQEEKKFIADILKSDKKMSFGDIHCMAMGIEATEENKKKIFPNLKYHALTDQIKQNSFVVHYNDVDKVEVQDIVDYCNK